MLASHTSTAVDILKTFDRELVDVLLDLAAAPKGSLAAQAVWKIAPEIARARAEADYAEGKVEPWISFMPEEHLGDSSRWSSSTPRNPCPRG